MFEQTHDTKTQYIFLLLCDTEILFLIMFLINEYQSMQDSYA